jgi:hypothetical protein
MKPAGRLLEVLVRANRLDAGAPILSERLPEAIADIGVASAGKFIEQDLAKKTRLEFVAPAAPHKKHGAAGIRRHWKNEPSLRAQALEPGRQWVGRPGAGDDDIALAQRNGRPVAVDNGDLRPEGKRRSRSLRQWFINLNRRNLSGRPNQRRQDRRVIAHAAAQMDHALTASDVQFVEHERPEAWLAIVQPTLLVVAINTSW